MKLSPAALHALEQSIAPERLARYRADSGGDLAAALVLYEWNIAIAEAFYSPLQTLEVIIRNAVGERLRVAYGQNWYAPGQASALRYPLPDMLSKAVAELTGRQIQPDHNRVLAELNFGFWAGALSRRYETDLWRPHLRHAFPHAPSPFLRKDVHEPLERLRRLRNRIAHHEPIYTRNLADDFADILRLVGWVSPDAATWVAATSRVNIVLGQHP